MTVDVVFYPDAHAFTVCLKGIISNQLEDEIRSLRKIDTRQQLSKMGSFYEY